MPSWTCANNANAGDNAWLSWAWKYWPAKILAGQSKSRSCIITQICWKCWPLYAHHYHVRLAIKAFRLLVSLRMILAYVLHLRNIIKNHTEASLKTREELSSWELMPSLINLCDHETSWFDWPANGVGAISMGPANSQIIYFRGMKIWCMCLQGWMLLQSLQGI